MNEGLHLFEGYGIELEYMIVDRESLAVRPIADRVLEAAAGSILADPSEAEHRADLERHGVEDARRLVTEAIERAS